MLQGLFRIRCLASRETLACMLDPHHRFGNKCKLPMFPSPRFSQCCLVPGDSAFEEESTKV